MFGCHSAVFCDSVGTMIFSEKAAENVQRLEIVGEYDKQSYCF